MSRAFLAGLVVTPLLGGRRPFGAGPREALAQAELASLAGRVRFLRSWLSQLLGSLPAPEDMNGKADADRAFDKLVKSRFPMLATKEGELVKLQAALNRLLDEPGELAQARALGIPVWPRAKMLAHLAEDRRSPSGRAYPPGP